MLVKDIRKQMFYTAHLHDGRLVRRVAALHHDYEYLTPYQRHHECVTSRLQFQVYTCQHSTLWVNVPRPGLDANHVMSYKLCVHTLNGVKRVKMACGVGAYIRDLSDDGDVFMTC